MKRLIEICFVFCCLGIIYICAKTDNFAKIRLFGQEKSISEELETIIEDNQLENFLFYSGENAICVYEGISFEINAHKFAVYKETVEKDILFENMLFIEHDTGDIYTWGGEELKKLTLINSFNMDEFHIVRSQHYYLDVESGNLYVGGEDVLSLRTELYYIGNIKE